MAKPKSEKKPTQPLPFVPPITVESFAELIQLHPESIRRAIRAGRLRAVKFGTKWGIPNDEAQRVLSNGLSCVA